MYHIYRSGSGASTPSCSHPPYGTTTKPYNPYGRYQDHYGSNRSNGVRVLKFGDTLTEKSLENELGEDSNTASSRGNIEDIKGKEEQENSNLHCGIILCLFIIVAPPNFAASHRIQVVISLTASDAISEYEEEEGDKDRVSRLFYLQLYSDTLDKEKHEEDKDYRKKIRKLYEFKRNSTRVRSHFIYKFFLLNIIQKIFLLI